MIYCVFGTPSAYSQFGSIVVQETVAAALGDVHYIAVCSMDELASAFEARDRRAVVFYSDSPSSEVVRLIRSVRAPTVVFTEELGDVATYCMRSRGMDMRAALQFTTQSVSTLSPFLTDATTLVLDRRDPPAGLQHFIANICSYFELRLASKAKNDVVRTIGGAASIEQLVLERVPQAEPKGSWSTRLSGDARKTISLVATTYEKLPVQPNAPLTWPVCLFRDSHNPEKSIDGPIDLLGPARSLVFGPLLHLPAGIWRVQAEFIVRDNWSGNGLLIDIVADERIVTSGRTSLPTQGRFVFSLDFSVERPEHPIALRIATEFGAIEGRIELLSSAVVRLG